MALRDILVKFLVDVDQTPLKEADEAAGQLIKRLRQLADAAGVTAVALGAKKLFGFIEDTVEAANMVDVFAKRLDVTTQQVQEFQAIAGVTGLQMNFFQHAFRTLNFQVAQSRPEFAELSRAAGGVKFNFKDTGELFWQVGEALSSVSDKTRRAYLAQTLLGRSAQQLMPIFSGSKEEIEAFRKKIQEVSEVFSKQFIEKAKVTWFQTNVMGLMWKKVAGLLTEQLLPAFDGIVNALQGAAKLTQDWIKSGEAMNTMVAAAITGVIALTVAFGGFLVEVLAVVAPFALLFVLVEDFVTFMRGGDSLIGRGFEKLFGPGGAQKAREEVKHLWDEFKQFLAWFANETATKGFFKAIGEYIELLVAKIRDSISELTVFLRDKLREALGDKASDFLGIPKTQKQEASNLPPGAPLPGMQLTAGVPGTGNPQTTADYVAQHPEDVNLAPDQLALAMDRAQRNGSFTWLEGLVDKLDTISQRAGHWLNGVPMSPGISNTGGGSVVNAPVTVENNITVQGNATAATAREIADSTGKATAASLGRDRSAVGAAVGIPQ